MVLGMRLAGVSGHIATDRETALAGLQEAKSRKDCAVVLMSERVAATIRDELNAHVYGAGYPLVLEIPDAAGPSSTRVSIEEIVRKAIGVSL
ncbi:MAG: V-type ATP synthase subunit F [Candidatus Hydrogenedentes bacterium]|nr:V-type ATP synthase subunit F [Candidatus Hydrogenedentota bacterium]